MGDAQPQMLRRCGWLSMTCPKRWRSVQWCLTWDCRYMIFWWWSPLFH